MGELLMPSRPDPSLLQQAQTVLRDLWKNLPAKRTPARIPENVVQAIQRSINSRTKTYRYVLPTQLLAKMVDPSLDARCVQADCRMPGAFDARSLCDAVIVPFDRQNHNVLGGSAEPYVNNPLRIGAIIETHRAAQRDKPGFDDLRLVLDYVQENPPAAEAALVETLHEIRARLTTVRIVYPVPNRISLLRAKSLLERFLATRTGGLRLQCVAVALFRCIGSCFRLFSDVRSANINAADRSTGSAADLECVDGNGRVVLAVEVKDRRLSLRHAQDKLPAIRQKGIRELIFLVQGGIEPRDSKAVGDLVTHEFSSGQNIYVGEFDAFTESCLVLLAEDGRRHFLQAVGEELDARAADVSHRQRWAELLSEA